MLPARRIVVISDFCTGDPGADVTPTVDDATLAWSTGERHPPPAAMPDCGRDEILVAGGYLERLPLACIRQGLCDTAEIWNFGRHEGALPFSRDSDVLARRAFRADGTQAPYASNDMLGHIAAFGPPEILCVWGLGVDEAILEACGSSFKIYNSIDAPALRIPTEVSRHFDLFLTGAQWQSDEVAHRHPGAATLVLPIGPDFASPQTFFPLASEKVYDVIYVAAAQPYKRHDILFDAMAKLPVSLRALCVCGYGELGNELRVLARDLKIDVDFIGPPGVGFEEVNRLMNSARIGVVCGVDDGAPAILTEYMLAGLPVLANASLCCGLQYITPSTGCVATADTFAHVLTDMLSRLDDFTPAATVLANWTWPHSVRRLADEITRLRCKKNQAVREHAGDWSVWRS